MQRELPTLAILGCGAAHDEICVGDGKPRNKTLPFCAMNGICSHGNDVLIKIIIDNEASGVLDMRLAYRMLETIRETQVELVNCIDQKSLYRRLLRSGTLSASEEKDLRTALGDDEERWDEHLKTLQLQRAQPIVQVMHKLEELGLLSIMNNHPDIDMRKFVERSYDRSTEPQLQ